jgi:hypothetical protein
MPELSPIFGNGLIDQAAGGCGLTIGRSWSRSRAHP